MVSWHDLHTFLTLDVRKKIVDRLGDTYDAGPCAEATRV